MTKNREVRKAWKCVVCLKKKIVEILTEKKGVLGVISTDHRYQGGGIIDWKHPEKGGVCNGCKKHPVVKRLSRAGLLSTYWWPD